MVSGRLVSKRFGARWRLIRNISVAIAACGLGSLNGASAGYIGDSYLQIPGVTGKGADHRRWVRIAAHYWKSDSGGLFGGGRRGQGAFYPKPDGPRDGASVINLAISKNSPLLPKLMQSCAKGTAFPEMTFAEQSKGAFHLQQGVPHPGMLPAEVPAFFEYKLKNAKITECPVVDGAPDQAIVIAFEDVDILNWDRSTENKEIKLQLAALPQISTTGKSKTFLLTWLGQANDISSDQCAGKVNGPPTEDEYYALVPKEAADKERAERASKGGVSFNDGTMDRRGPNKLNVIKLPGIVKDPGQYAPITKVARGLNLDGDDGRGKPPPGICKHENFTSEDGKGGIDNQLYRVQGCTTGFQGRRGFMVMYGNEQRRNSTRHTLIHISGIDDERNDPSIEVSFLHSSDPMAKSADGKTILADYTYHLTKDPDLSHFTQSVKAKIVNGVIETSAPVDMLRMMDFAGHLNFYKGAFRLEIRPDGTMTGLVGGYMDWRRTLMQAPGSIVELSTGMKLPAFYNAFRRYADGLKDPDTGECFGISVAYDLDAVPAFLPAEQAKRLIAGVGAKSGGSR